MEQMTVTIARTKCMSSVVPKKATESSPVRITDSAVAYPLSTLRRAAQDTAQQWARPAVRGAVCEVCVCAVV